MNIIIFANIVVAGDCRFRLIMSIHIPQPEESKGEYQG